MSALGYATKSANRLLRSLNIKIDTLTAERAEMERLIALKKIGHFDRAIFPVLEQFQQCNPWPILEEVKQHEERFAEFAALPVGSDKGFSLANAYYPSPDAEVLYAMVRLYKPSVIIEVGSGNSTMLFRHAISDGRLPSKLVSIDPVPRCEVMNFTDEIISNSSGKFEEPCVV